MGQDILPLGGDVVRQLADDRGVVSALQIVFRTLPREVDFSPLFISKKNVGL
jgi:hypothetical protein